MPRKFKSAKHKGTTITFHDQGHGLILAKASSVTRQFIGSGKNKTQALNSAKRALNVIKKKK